MLDFIIWNASPEIFTIPEFFNIGPLAPRWYGLFFAIGFFLGQQIISKICKIEGTSEEHLETLTIYMIVATIIGARLGHCIFYEPNEFFWSPDKLVKILYIWQGGLASHGAGIAIIIAIYLFKRKYPKLNYLYLMDRIAIIVALSAFLIRLGNFTNSEIVGTPTMASQGVVFAASTTASLEERYHGVISDIRVKENGLDSSANGIYYTGVDIRLKVKSFGNGNIQEMAQTNIRGSIESGYEYGNYITLSNAKDAVTIGNESKEGTEVILKAWGIPRHPSQLYESISSLILFFLLIFVYSRFKANTPNGLLFGIFMVWIFTLRFFYEFIKEDQVGFERDMVLNMGQILSIPMVIAGIVLLVISYKNYKQTKG